MCEIRPLPLKLLLYCLVFVKMAGAQNLTSDSLTNSLYKLIPGQALF